MTLSEWYIGVVYLKFWARFVKLKRLFNIWFSLVQKQIKSIVTFSFLGIYSVRGVNISLNETNAAYYRRDLSSIFSELWAVDTISWFVQILKLST